MRLIAIERIAFTLGDGILDACCLDTFFCPDRVDKCQQTVVANLDFIHIGRGPSRRTNPHLALAVAV